MEKQFEDIIEETIFQFELKDDISLIYNKDRKLWFIQTEDSEIESDTYIVEDPSSEIFYIEEEEVFGYILSIEDFNNFKKIVEVNKD